jgi:hypothetical protein
MQTTTSLYQFSFVTSVVYLMSDGVHSPMIFFRRILLLLEELSAILVEIYHKRNNLANRKKLTIIQSFKI